MPTQLRLVYSRNSKCHTRTPCAKSVKSPDTLFESPKLTEELLPMKAAQLIAERPRAAKVIEKLVDDLLAERKQKP